MPKLTRGAAKGASAAVIAAAVAFITPWEGIRTKVYLDIVGVPTICVGQTKADGVDFARTYTIAECKQLFARTLPKYDAGMIACLDRDMPDSVHVAMLSATYNIGIAGFCGSTMGKLINAGDFAAACDALLAWNKARPSHPTHCISEMDDAGRCAIRGLDNRRRAERKLCLEGL